MFKLQSHMTNICCLWDEYFLCVGMEVTRTVSSYDMVSFFKLIYYLIRHTDVLTLPVMMARKNRAPHLPLCLAYLFRSVKCFSFFFYNQTLIHNFLQYRSDNKRNCASTSIIAYMLHNTRDVWLSRYHCTYIYEYMNGL